MERREESEREEKLGVLVGRWPRLSPLIMISRYGPRRSGVAKDYS